MGIVRGDRREAVKDTVAQLRVAALQGYQVMQIITEALDQLEVELGLASPEDLKGREHYLVAHVAAGEEEAHDMGECDRRGCMETKEGQKLIDLLGGDDDDAKDKGAEPEGDNQG